MMAGWLRTGRILARGALPALVIALGAWWCVALIAAVPDDVFYSGDGGLKAAMVRQLTLGRVVPWLELGEPPWVRALWDAGMYPFRPPFAHELDGRTYSSFEWAFPALSVPGYALTGYRGLYVVPALGVLAVWVRFAFVARALGAGALATTLALAFLVFATPLTFYGATFWEHAPAVALAFAGLADLLVLETDRRRSRAVRAGLLLGAACWLRPEALLFGAACLAAHALSRRRRLVMLAGLGFACVVAAQLAFNRAAYGTWLGVHAIEALGRSSASRTDEAIELARLLRDAWLEHVPLTWLAALLACAALPSSGLRGASCRRSVVVVLLSFAAIVGIAPNDGGHQIGPRYLLLLVPPVALAAALGMEQLRSAPRTARWGLAALTAVLITLTAEHSVLTRAEDFLHDYTAYMLPSIRALGGRPNAGVVFGHPWAALEMAAVIDERPVVTIDDRAQLDRAAEAMVEHGYDVLLVDGPNDRRFPFEGRHRHGPVELEWAVISRRGEYSVLLGRRAR